MLELAGPKPGWRNCGAYADLFRPPVAKKSAKTDVTQPLIQAVNLDEPEPLELSQEELEAGGRT
jgi:hypothetical protein